MLVAIAIPVFTTQLEKSRESTDIANVRSAYAGIVTDYLADTASYSTLSATVSAQQKQTGWQTSEHSLVGMSGSNEYSIDIPSEGAKAGGSWELTINESGVVSLTGK